MGYSFGLGVVIHMAVVSTGYLGTGSRIGPGNPEYDILRIYVCRGRSEEPGKIRL